MKTDFLKVIDHLRCEAGGLSDGQLLARFVTARDGSALETLVRRHGKMVYGVCRRVLRNPQDAEDAFQKTFLTLTRKAASVVKRESFGSWLYNVAYHAALDLAASSARRRSMERQVQHLPHPVILPAEPEDWRPLLDLELSRLPEKYRSAVVLCDLEGLSRKEASARLGIPEGTLSSRLTAAHKMLAKRLGRGGLILSVCAISAALSGLRASAAVPATLARSVAKAALAVGSAPTAFFVLKGALQMMLATKWWPVVAATVVAGTMAAVGVGFRSGDTSVSAQTPGAKQESELEALRKENELLKRNLQIVLEKFGAMEAELQALRGSKEGKPSTKESGAQNYYKRTVESGEAAKAAILEKLAAEEAAKAKVAGAKAAEGAKAAILEKLAADAAAEKAKAAGKKPAGPKDELIRELEELLKKLRDTPDNQSKEGELRKLKEKLAK